MAHDRESDRRAEEADSEASRMTRVIRALANFYCVPVVGCPRHGCRRRRGCLFIHEPGVNDYALCLLLYGGNDAALLNAVTEACGDMLAGAHATTASENAERRDIEEAAIEICKAAIVPGTAEAERFGDFLRRYRTPPMSDAERRIFIEKTRLELEIMQIENRLYGL